MVSERRTYTMGILARFKDIMSANINALLDKCEDPAKMIDEYMRQLTEELADEKRNSRCHGRRKAYKAYAG